MEEKKYDILSTVSGDYLTTFNRTYLARKKWEPENPGNILSFMPGTVEKIVVKPGAKVREGELLMVFRAMKMNNNIIAPIAGKIKSINVDTGENVRKGVVMIEIE